MTSIDFSMVVALTTLKNQSSMQYTGWEIEKYTFKNQFLVLISILLKYKFL